MNESHFDIDLYVHNMTVLYAEAIRLKENEVNNAQKAAMESDGNEFASECYLAMDWPTFIDVPR